MDGIGRGMPDVPPAVDAGGHAGRATPPAATHGRGRRTAVGRARGHQRETPCGRAAAAHGHRASSCARQRRRSAGATGDRRGAFARIRIAVIVLLRTTTTVGAGRIHGSCIGCHARVVRIVGSMMRATTRPHAVTGPDDGAASGASAVRAAHRLRRARRRHFLPRAGPATAATPSASRSRSAGLWRANLTDKLFVTVIGLL